MKRPRAYANRVNIVKTVKSNNKWIAAPAVERNGKVVRDHVLIRGKDEHHPEGRCYLDWYQDGKKRRQAVASFDDLVSAARAKFAELQARSAGILGKFLHPLASNWVPRTWRRKLRQLPMISTKAIILRGPASAGLSLMALR